MPRHQLDGPRIGSLFTGYGGLDMGAQAVLGGSIEWVSEIDAPACTVLQAHHAGIPNLGDITTVDWATTPRVDILTGGYPCQPFSTAGDRKGHTDDRHLWPYVADAIRHLVPSLVVLENVRGHYSLGFGTVIGDLAGMGYDARWGCVRAADAGAPHQRARVFIVAHPHRPGHSRFHDPSGPRTLRAGLRPRPEGYPLPAAVPANVRHERDRDPGPGRPRPEDSGGNPISDAYIKRETGDTGRAEQTEGPTVAGGSGVDWGKYGAAIRRWEHVTGRPAPAPTVPGNGGRPRLSHLFTEWMMGLPEGHVTGHGLPRTAALRLCGNGVVPQQAALALRMLGVGA